MAIFAFGKHARFMSSLWTAVPAPILEPRRILALCAFLPVVVEPPIANYLNVTSYEATNSPLWWAQYILEVIIVAFVVSSSLVYGHNASVEDLAERAVRSKLAEQAAKAIRLLTTAMPPHIAQALIERRPALELMDSGDHVAIAFIRLTDYAALAASLDHIALLSWLDSVYATFDKLIDVYADTGERPGVLFSCVHDKCMHAQITCTRTGVCASVNGNALSESSCFNFQYVRL